MAAFRALLRRDPENAPARAAVRRIEIESAMRRPRGGGSPPAGETDIIARLFLVLLPRWYYFERTVGDAARDVGTLDAMNGRLTQLSCEKKVALARRRPFAKDRQLRELLRRTPAVMELEEV